MSKHAHANANRGRSTAPTIGVLDWGVGGLGVVASLRRRGVSDSVVYVSDSGATPYGRMDPEVLNDRVQRVCDWMVEEGCGLVILACNAASTVRARLDVGDVPIVGMIACMADYVARQGCAEVGLLGGRRTVESQAYEQALAALGCATKVRARVAQPLSALVEAGVLEGPELEREIMGIVAPLSDVSVLVSACTHYAAIRPQIEAMLPDLRDWVEPAELATTALITAGRVSVRDSEIADDDLQPTERFLTSGDPDALRGAGLAAFGVRIVEVETLPV